MDSIAGISYYLTILLSYYHVIYNNFVFVCIAFNAVQLLQCITLNFLSPDPWPP